MTVPAFRMTYVGGTTLAAPGSVTSAARSPSRTAGSPADLSFAHGALHPIAAGLLLHDHFTTGAVDGLSTG